MSRTPKRPGVVTTAAVLLFVYGSLCLMCGGLSGLIHLVIGFEGFGHGPQGLLAKLPGYKIVGTAVDVMNLFLGLLMVLAGVGVVRLMPIARSAACLAAVGHVFVAIGFSIYQLIYVMPTFRQLGMENQMWTDVIIITIITSGFALSIITLLSQRESRDAFAANTSGAPPEEYRTARLRFEGYDEEANRPAKAPRSPGDTGITESPD